MARQKIQMPESFGFKCSIPVRITDVNYGGHVGNDSIVSIIHEARMQYLRHLGYSELEFAGVGLIMTDLVVEFKREGFYGDRIDVAIAAGDFSRVGFTVYYQLSKKDESGNVHIVAHAQTGMVCYDYSAKKVSAVPDEARRVLD